VKEAVAQDLDAPSIRVPRPFNFRRHQRRRPLRGTEGNRRDDTQLPLAVTADDYKIKVI